MMKNYLYILLVILIILLIIYLISKKKIFSSGNNNADSATIIGDTLQKIKKTYGVEIAKNVEKIYRLETAHFTSNIFKNTFSAGMLAFNDNYPYGWFSLVSFWEDNPDYKPSHYYQSVTGYKYVAFPSFTAAAYTLAEFLKKKGNNAGAWYSINPEKQDYYISLLNNIQTTYV